jgi:putative DNA primase/helicase
MLSRESSGILRLDDFLAEETSITWLIEGWIQEKSLIMVHGPSGAGKTFLVLDWCLRLSAGKLVSRNWCGHAVKFCPVLYLAGEGQHGLRGRIAAWRKHFSVKDNQFFILPRPLDLDQKDVGSYLLGEIHKSGISPGLVVIDTLNRYFSGDENSARDARGMIDSCSALIERYGCSVLLVHHTGLASNAQNRARGSSAWRGALDIEISVKSGGATRPIQVLQQKMKDVEKSPSKYFQFLEVTSNKFVDGSETSLSSVVMQEVEKPEAPLAKTNALFKSRFQFEQAWVFSGCEYDSSKRPHVKRSAMLEFLMSSKVGATASAARRSTQSDPNRLIGRLIDVGDIEIFESGWSVMSSPMRIRLSELVSKKTDEDNEDIKLSCSK